MGASASVSPELPPELSDDDIQKLIGKEFDNLRGVLNSFKNEEGKIDTKEFLKHFESEQEREVYHFYEYYCTADGLLRRSQFLSLCRKAKLLNKTTLPSTAASALFSNHCIDVDEINYFVFRKQLLQDIATILGISLDDILSKLAQIEVAIDFDSRNTTIYRYTTAIIYIRWLLCVCEIKN
jgi:hypothetical protein